MNGIWFSSGWISGGGGEKKGNISAHVRMSNEKDFLPNPAPLAKNRISLRIKRPFQRLKVRKNVGYV